MAECGGNDPPRRCRRPCLSRTVPYLSGNTPYMRIRLVGTPASLKRPQRWCGGCLFRPLMCCCKPPRLQRCALGSSVLRIAQLQTACIWHIRERGVQELFVRGLLLQRGAGNHIANHVICESLNTWIKRQYCGSKISTDAGTGFLKTPRVVLFMNHYAI